MRLATFEWGNPELPPMVCIHGVGGHNSYFERAAKERWADSYRVISVDLRGHGDSGWLAPWTHATFVDDLIDTIDDLRLDSTHFVGSSFGGRLLLQLIERAPNRVRRAAVLEPVIQISPEVATRRAEQELALGTWPSMQAFYEYRRGVSAGDIDYDEFVKNYGGNFDTQDDGSIRRRTSQAAIVSIFSEFALPAAPPESVSVPTMILYGRESGLVTAAQRVAYAPYVQEFVDVPGRHAVFTSAFEETSAAVKRFLAE